MHIIRMASLLFYPNRGALNAVQKMRKILTNALCEIERRVGPKVRAESKNLNLFEKSQDLF
jgi:hypothetical protein